MRVKKALENLITSGITFDEDSDLKWRLVIINLIGIVAIANLIPLCIYSLIRGTGHNMLLITIISQGLIIVINSASVS